MLFATEQIRRMRGGAQSHLMRCSDGHYYVIKFQNNPQHRRILVNELLGTRLAGRLGLPTRSRVPCQAGLQFGSRYPGDPRRLTLHDFLPDEQLRGVENLHDFAGMLVFDKWTCNTNGRQTIFSREEPRRPIPQGDGPENRDAPSEERDYRATMIDQGFCFNAGEWNYPDAPLRGLYARNRVYEGVIGMESFAPWTERVERSVTERVLAEVLREIPPEWYEDDYDSVTRLVEQLYRRRTRVPELLLDAKNTTRQPFPNWR